MAKATWRADGTTKHVASIWASIWAVEEKEKRVAPLLSGEWRKLNKLNDASNLHLCFYRNLLHLLLFGKVNYVYINSFIFSIIYFQRCLTVKIKIVQFRGTVKSDNWFSYKNTIQHWRKVYFYLVLGVIWNLEFSKIGISK